jgi:sodium transport system ATP-binding protein
VLHLVQDFRTRGRTVIFSTHIMSEAERVCDEVAIIERGEILARGPVEEVRRRAASGLLEDAFVDVVGGAGGGPGDDR